MTGILSRISESLVPSVDSGDEESSSWCLTPSRQTISKSYYLGRSLHLGSFSRSSATLSIALEAWWSVWTINPVCSRYERIRSITQTTASLLEQWCWGSSRITSRFQITNRTVYRHCRHGYVGESALFVHCWCFRNGWSILSMWSRLVPADR